MECKSCKEFILKYKKSLIIGSVVLTFIAFRTIYSIMNHSSKATEQVNEVKQINTKNQMKTYNKAIFKDNNLVDLKYNSNLTVLQKEMLLLMKKNFICLGTDWDKAISENKASKKNDFSNCLQNNELKYDILKPSYYLGLLEDWPSDENNQIHNMSSYEMFHELKNISSRKWNFKLKNNLKFENNKSIDNAIIEYSFLKNREMLQSSYENLQDDRNSYPENLLLFLDTNFCIEPKNSLSFSLNYSNPKTLKDVISMLNSLTLLPSEEFEKSYKNRTIDRNDYGTKEFPFISYGPYKLIQGYDNEENWVFEKNPFYYDFDSLFLEQICYKNVENFEKAKELYLKKEINELIIPEEKKCDYVSDPNLLKKTTSNVFYIYFNPSEIEELQDNDKTNKIKTNFFINHVKFRKALLFAINRQKLLENNIKPSFSFVSDTTLLNDYIFFNTTNFHKNNIKNIFNLNNENFTDMEIVDKSFQPEKSLQLFQEVEKEFQKTQNDSNDVYNNKPLKISLIFDPNVHPPQNSILINVLKTNLENVFQNKIIFDVVNSGEFNLDIGQGCFAQMKNINNIFCYLADQIKNYDKSDRIFHLSNSPDELNIEQLRIKLMDMQNSLGKKNNLKELYYSSLKDLEKESFDNLYCLPLYQEQKYKIYSNLEFDFTNSFLLYGLNDTDEW